MVRAHTCIAYKNYTYDVTIPSRETSTRKVISLMLKSGSRLLTQHVTTVVCTIRLTLTFWLFMLLQIFEFCETVCSAFV